MGGSDASNYKKKETSIWADAVYCGKLRAHIGPDVKERYTTVMAFSDRVSGKLITPRMDVVGVSENGEINEGWPVDEIECIKIAGDFIKIEDDVAADIYWDNRLVGAPVYELQSKEVGRYLDIFKE